jgi:hypothetical protein
MNGSAAVQDRTIGSVSDGEIDRPGEPGDQRDHGRPVPLPMIPSPMPEVEAQILGVGPQR